MTASKTPRRQHEQSVIRHMIIVAVGQETVGDAARFNMQPRHLLHTSAAAVEKDPRRPNVHQDRRAAAQRIRIGCAGSEKANFHDNSLLPESDWNIGIMENQYSIIPSFHLSSSPASAADSARRRAIRRRRAHPSQPPETDP